MICCGGSISSVLLFLLNVPLEALTSPYNRYRSTNDVFETGLFMLLLLVSLFVGNVINLNLRVSWPIILIVLRLGFDHWPPAKIVSAKLQEQFMESILEVKDLKKNYGDFAVVKGITFNIKEG